MRWKAYFFLHPDQSTSTKENFGFKSTKNPPPIDELKDFEDGMMNIIQATKFKPVNNKFLNNLNKDIKHIKNDSSKLLIPADKTTNFYTLHLVDGFIQTDVYSKPTGSHLYLSPSSAHPKHVFKAIPFGVALRLRRNCSKDCFLNKRLKEYKGYLVDQGYPEELVSREFSRAASIPRNDLLQAKVRDSKKIFPFFSYI